MIQWLKLGVFSAEAPCLILGWGMKLLQPSQHSQKKKKKLDVNSMIILFRNKII